MPPQEVLRGTAPGSTYARDACSWPRSITNLELSPGQWLDSRAVVCLASGRAEDSIAREFPMASNDDIKWTATSSDGETFNLSFHGLTRDDAFRMLSTMHDIQRDSGRTCTTIFDWTTLALSREVIESQLTKQNDDHPLLPKRPEIGTQISAHYRDHMTRLSK